MCPAVAEDSLEKGGPRPIAEASIVVPQRLAVIRQANHPRACYLNGRRYAVTSQLPLSTGSLIAPIGSWTALLCRISGQCRWVFNNGPLVRSSGSVSTMKTFLYENRDLLRENRLITDCHNFLAASSELPSNDRMLDLFEKLIISLKFSSVL